MAKAIPHTVRQGGTKMELLILIAVVVLWFVAQAWILPRFGVQT